MVVDGSPFWRVAIIPRIFNRTGAHMPTMGLAPQKQVLSAFKLSSLSNLSLKALNASRDEILRLI